MEVRNRKQTNSEMALYETNRELESQRLELYQENQWADQAQRQKKSLCREMEMRNRLFREDRAKNVPRNSRIMENLLRRNRSSKTPQKRDPTTGSQLLTLIQNLQNKVDSLSAAREFYDPETASSSGASDVPSQPLAVPSPRETRSLGSGSPRDTRNIMGTSGNVFEDLPAREGPPFRKFKDFGIIFLSRSATSDCRKYLRNMEEE